MSDLTPAQMRLKDEFTAIRGYWNPMWDSALRAIPEYLDAYLRFSAVPYQRGPLDAKTKELISIAINAAMTHMYEPAVRVHIQNALRLGATRAEILEVFALISILGVHTSTFSVPILLQELERKGKPVDMVNLSPRAKEVQAEWVRVRGYWPPNLTSILALDPDFVAAFANIGATIRAKGPLDLKTVELIFAAIDASATHLFEPGVRLHIVAAMDHGATVDEIMETLELACVLGMHSLSFGIPILDEEIAKYDSSR
jgi:alkylhydroperoxidase/carboxymuconolactone decarboxylase family protein YurZ